MTKHHPLPLVPQLPCALRAREKFNPAAGFREGDFLHLTRDVAGRPGGSVLPVLGQCICCEADGTPYAVRVYTLPLPEHSTAYATRDAARFPAEFQQETWFGGVQMRFSEIDITDFADCLALERTHEAVVVQMYPRAEYVHRLAA